MRNDEKTSKNAILHNAQCAMLNEGKISLVPQNESRGQNFPGLNGAGLNIQLGSKCNQQLCAMRNAQCEKRMTNPKMDWRIAKTQTAQCAMRNIHGEETSKIAILHNAQCAILKKISE